MGWSFAWRALMAGELLFVAGGLGQLLANGRELLDTSQVMAVAIVIIGVGIDRVLFRALQRKVHVRWGLVRPGVNQKHLLSTVDAPRPAGPPERV